MQAATLPVEAPVETGIYAGIDNEAYHSGPGVSRTGLWTMYTKTPAHFRFSEPSEKRAFDRGAAAHLAILEPARFEKAVMRGPDDRRGNKWKDAEIEAINSKRLLLTSGDYDAVLFIRDAVHANSFVNTIITSGKPLIENTAYWIDEETGELCRCRPDVIRTDLGVMLDLKTTRDASSRGFGKSIGEYGYHAQEAFYTEGWHAAGGAAIEGTVFLAIESAAPYAFGIYELPPSAVEEGRAAMRQALSLYTACRKADHWPAYATDVQEIALPRWAYRLTPAPAGSDE